MAETNTSTTSVISLTESAAAEVKEMMIREPDRPGDNLRVYVEQGGCSGMQYGMVFDEERPDDFKGAFFGVGVVVDPFSAKYLGGSVVDFSDAMTGGGFKIKNPKASESCGCGKSFNARGKFSSLKLPNLQNDSRRSTPRLPRNRGSSG